MDRSNTSLPDYPNYSDYGNYYYNYNQPDYNSPYQQPYVPTSYDAKNVVNSKGTTNPIRNGNQRKNFGNIPQVPERNRPNKNRAPYVLGPLVKNETDDANS